MDLSVNGTKKIIKSEFVYFLVPSISSVRMVQTIALKSLNQQLCIKAQIGDSLHLFSPEYQQNSGVRIRPYQIAAVFEEDCEMVKPVVFIKTTAKLVGKLTPNELPPSPHHPGKHPH